MGGLEHGHAVGEIGARRNADAAHLGRERVGNVVAIEVERGDHVIFVRAQEDLLQEGVSDHVFHHDVAAGLGIFEAHPRPAVEQLRAEFLAGQTVAPIAEGTFGELHDVALVHQGDRLAVIVDGVLQGLAHQPLGALTRHRLDADARGFGEADFFHPHLVDEEIDEFLRPLRLGGPLDAGVDVFGVLAENDHIGLFRVFDRRWHALEIAHRTQADVEVELLPQRDVERADAATHRGGQRALDRHHVIAQDLKGDLGQPHVRAVHPRGLFAGENFHPGDLALAAVGLLNRRVHHLDHHRGDVEARAVALDVRNDGMVGNVERKVRVDRDFFACGHADVLIHGGSPSVVTRAFYASARVE